MMAAAGELTQNELELPAAVGLLFQKRDRN